MIILCRTSSNNHGKQLVLCLAGARSQTDYITIVALELMCSSMTCMLLKQNQFIPNLLQCHCRQCAATITTPPVVVMCVHWCHVWAAECCVVRLGQQCNRVMMLGSIAWLKRRTGSDASSSCHRGTAPSLLIHVSQFNKNTRIQFNNNTVFGWPDVCILRVSVFHIVNASSMTCLTTGYPVKSILYYSHL